MQTAVAQLIGCIVQVTMNITDNAADDGINELITLVEDDQGKD
jgi:hypothetical protein